MLLIGTINLVLGFLVWPSEARHPKKPEPILYDVPSFYTPDAAVVDAAPPVMPGQPATLEAGGFAPPQVDAGAAPPTMK
jgi:hypothetical protein